MMKDMDEEDDLLFDQQGLLDLRKRKSTVSVWCHNFIKTICLSLTFFTLGLCIAVPGPTLLDLGERVNTDTTHISLIFTARSVGYMFGSLLGGCFFDHLDKQLLLFTSLVVAALATIIIPWCLTLTVLMVIITLQGVTMGMLDTGGNTYCIRIWNKKSPPYMQAMHFAFGIGAFIAPLISQPFLSNRPILGVTNESISALGTYGQIPMVRNGDIINELKANSSRKIRSSKGESQSLPPTNISDLVTKASKEAANGLVSNASTATVTDFLTTTILPTTARKPTKPKNIDGELLSHDTGHASGKKIKPFLKNAIDKAKQPQNGQKVVPPVTKIEKPKDSIEKKDELEKNNVTATDILNEGNDTNSNTSSQTSTTPRSQASTKSQTSTKVGTLSSTTASLTTTSSLTNPIVNIAGKTSVETNTASEKTTILSTTSVATTTTIASTTSTKVLTTSTQAPTTSTQAPTTSTQAPTTSTQAPTTSTSVATPKATTQTPTKQIPSVKIEKPSTTSSDGSKSSTVSSSSTISLTGTSANNKSLDITTDINNSTNGKTDEPHKPSHTIGDIFSSAMNAVKNMSKIQFAYLIIGGMLLVNAAFFFILYCFDRNKSDYSALEENKNADSGSGSIKCRVLILILMFFFILAYVGIETTFGGLIMTFTVNFKSWTKDQGAILTAIFWGSLAAGRGLSIFITGCCKPHCMLTLDLVLVVVGSLVLSFGVSKIDFVLWLGTLCLGFGMSSVFPTSVTWVEQYYRMNGKSTAVLVMGSALGQMIVPVTTGYFFQNVNNMSLMYVVLCLSLLMSLLFLIMQLVASKTGTSEPSSQNGFMRLKDEDNLELDDINYGTSTQESTRRRFMPTFNDVEYDELRQDEEEDLLL